MSKKPPRLFPKCKCGCGIASQFDGKCQRCRTRAEGKRYREWVSGPRPAPPVKRCGSCGQFFEATQAACPHCHPGFDPDATWRWDRLRGEYVKA